MDKTSNTLVQGFLHAQGRQTVNGMGQPIVLRGWGAGNWMNPEGFMTFTAKAGFAPEGVTSSKLAPPHRADRLRSIHYAIRELCGTKYAEQFWPRWFRSYFGEGDIKAMSEAGYNSVRLPLDASAFLYEEPGIQFNEDSFQVLDHLLDLCEQYHLYAILDLHGTPGHSGVACDNGLDNYPRLFDEPETFERMVILWEKIARRYQDRWIVGAYELLNEPLFPAWLRFTPKLAEFYREVIKRIRVFDQKHLFILSGPEVGTNLCLFTDENCFDPEFHNWMYTVHGYWLPPHMESLYKLMEPSLRLNVPMWYGEGRNTESGMAMLYEMCVQNDIGFNLFCWKSEGVAPMPNGPVEHFFPEGWEKIEGYLVDGGPRPSYAEAQELFDQLLECVKFENCRVDYASFRYSQRRQGIELPGAAYDAGKEGKDFSGGWDYGNAHNFRPEDHTKLVLRPGLIPASQGGTRRNPQEELLLELTAGQFANYTVHNVTSLCNVSIEYYGVCSGSAIFSCDGYEKTLDFLAEEEPLNTGLFPLPLAERHTVHIAVVSGTLRVSRIRFPLSIEQPIER